MNGTVISLILAIAMSWAGHVFAACTIQDVEVTAPTGTISFGAFALQVTDSASVRVETSSDCESIALFALRPTNPTPNGLPRVQLSNGAAGGQTPASSTTLYDNQSAAFNTRQTALARATPQSDVGGIKTFTMEYALTLTRAENDPPLPPGTALHAVQLEVDALDAPNSVAATDNSKKLELSVSVAEHVSAHFAGANIVDDTITSHQLAFGTLSPDENTTASINVIIETNVGYEISISTDHGGALQHGGGNWSIPYSVALDNSSVILSETAVSAKNDRNLVGEAALPLDVTVSGSNVGSVRAGTYSDILTFQIQRAP